MMGLCPHSTGNCPLYNVHLTPLGRLTHGKELTLS
jgi:hypothetical protein